MSGLVRIEERYRDGARVDGTEERHDVVEALRSEDRHAVTGRRHLLQARGHGAQTGTELRPGELVHLTVALRE